MIKKKDYRHDIGRKPLKIFINMGFMVLYITNDDRLMKRIDLVKLKFHSNENIE